MSYNSITKALASGFSQFSILDFLDIVIIAVLIYKLIVWTKETRAYEVLKGIGLLFLCLILVTVEHALVQGLAQRRVLRMSNETLTEDLESLLKARTQFASGHSAGLSARLAPDLQRARLGRLAGAAEARFMAQEP